MQAPLMALLIVLLALGCQPPPTTPAEPQTAAPAMQAAASAASVAQAEGLALQGPGFTSRRSLENHFAKHGREFGSISADEYLALAQRLRDAPVSETILEIVREVDGVITRYDRTTQHFGAYNSDGTIRTFFIPNDGEAYFRRQALRRPQ